MKSYVLACAAALAPAAAIAQVAAAPLAPPAIAPAIAPAVQPIAPPIAAPATSSAVLRIGTELPLRLSEELTTKGKQLRVGHRFRMTTAEPILVQGVTVIPAGSPAVGEITAVRNKGMWGKSGHFAGRILYVTVNGRQIRLTGAFDDKGTAGGVGAVAVSALVFLPAGFFMTGTSAVLPVGTVVKSFIDEDVPLQIAAAAPAPMVVAAPAAAPVPAAAPAATAPVAAAAPPVAAAAPATTGGTR